MSVNLVDPNLLNTNPDFVNGIPQYQDMFIFAELTAKSRGRTVLETNNTGQYSLSKTGSQDEININFIGNNQNKSATDPNYLKFTTNWYDGSAAEGFQYEGFGISSIKVIINSSFVPQVNIQFIDVRGLAFFNQKDSPYRILFNFPPPIFTLTIKGYYGMPLVYQLHLVKYTSEFKAENGNFIIDAQFVAMTFAPLTDVLFRYVVNFPLIPNKGNEIISINPAPETPPINTYDLILKLKNLFAATTDKTNTDLDSKAYDNIISKETAINTVFTSLYSFKSSTLNKWDWGAPFGLISLNETVSTSGVNDVTVVEQLYDYDKTIEQYAEAGYPENIPERLLIGYFLSKEIVEVNLVNSVTSKYFEKLTPDQSKLIALNEYRNGLISQIKNGGPIVYVIEDADIQKAKSVPTTMGTYLVIDITKYYIKLYKERIKIKEEKVAELDRIRVLINQMIQGTLGIRPTIYNIFKIILDDVDTFFKILRSTSISAEEYYKNPDILRNIVNSELYKDTSNKIFAFPLVVKQQNVCDGVKESRTIPKDLSTPDNPLPEVKLVQDFVNTFILQRNITALIDMKNTVNAENVNIWIPICPFDSKLGTNTSSSPYFLVDSVSQAIPLSVDNKLVQALKIMLKRFYILSQFAFPTKFYEGNDGTNSYITMFAESEAINLAISLFNYEYINLLRDFSLKNKNADIFYGNITTLIPNLYKFLPGTYEFFSLVDSAELPTSRTNYLPGDAYVDKNNPNYHGFIFSSKDIVLQTATEVSNAEARKARKGENTAKNPIDKFRENSARLPWKDWFKSTSLESTLKFSNENVVFIQDVELDGGGENGNVNTKTRFLTNHASVQVQLGKEPSQDEIILNSVSTNSNQTVNRVNAINSINKNNAGNTYFATQPIDDAAKKLEVFNDIVEVWSEVLCQNDTAIYSTIINPTTPENRRLSQIVIASNFGYALSTFNIFPNDLNDMIFKLPAAVYVPSFIGYYMGSLVGIEKPLDETDTNEYTSLYNFFVLGEGRNIGSSGALIFADIVDINNQVALADRETLKKEYILKFVDSDTYNNIIANLKEVYQEVQQRPTVVAAKKIIDDKIKNKQSVSILDTETYTSAKQSVYLELLKSEGYNQWIIEPLMERNCIVNFSEKTFQRISNPKPLYESLATTNNDSRKKFNDNYFRQFFGFLYEQLKNKDKQNLEQKKLDDSLIGDEDILTQTYYSFKNINDKWLSSPSLGDKNSGYPSFSNTPTGPLINLFAFVDRAMNPIGDTIINPEILIQLLDDPNVSVFSVLAQLLSMNGFEFFPLQNFMNISGGTWQDSFKIDTRGDVKPRPAFVCMYIGGSSRYPTTIESFGGQFKDDSISDISNVKEFNIGKCNNIVPADDNQMETNKNFPWRQVNAFKVRFGEQNQSMFTDIKIDSKEYPDTNESIQILSRIAGDNKEQAPPPKGQNLYNLYENRSYKATISGLGNAMIQPTQYFQLENVPLFNGAYIILSVEHNIEPNKMTTSFSGTKILRYPIPRVLEASVLLGFDGGNTTETNANELSDTTITEGPGASAGKSQAQYNSMYEFKIK